MAKSWLLRLVGWMMEIVCSCHWFDHVWSLYWYHVTSFSGAITGGIAEVVGAARHAEALCDTQVTCVNLLRGGCRWFWFTSPNGHPSPEVLPGAWHAFLRRETAPIGTLLWGCDWEGRILLWRLERSNVHCNAAVHVSLRLCFQDAKEQLDSFNIDHKRHYISYWRCKISYNCWTWILAIFYLLILLSIVSPLVFVTSNAK